MFYSFKRFILFNLQKIFRDERNQRVSKENIKVKKIKEVIMININDKSNCCGCQACFNKCPKGAITMIEDKKGLK